MERPRAKFGDHQLGPSPTPSIPSDFRHNREGVHRILAHSGLNNAEGLEFPASNKTSLRELQRQLEHARSKLANEEHGYKLGVPDFTISSLRRAETHMQTLAAEVDGREREAVNAMNNCYQAAAEHPCQATYHALERALDEGECAYSDTGRNTYLRIKKLARALPRLSTSS